MKFFETTKDGGDESTVWAHWFFELKGLASAALLRFENGTREAYHSHAFNCVSWVLWGELVEQHLDGRVDVHRPGLRPVITRRDTFHKVRSVGRTWVLTFRGPWVDTWQEFTDTGVHTLTHGRREVQP